MKNCSPTGASARFQWLGPQRCPSEAEDAVEDVAEEKGQKREFERRARLVRLCSVPLVAFLVLRVRLKIVDTYLLSKDIQVLVPRVIQQVVDLGWVYLY